MTPVMANALANIVGGAALMWVSSQMTEPVAHSIMAVGSGLVLGIGIGDFLSTFPDKEGDR